MRLITNGLKSALALALAVLFSYSTCLAQAVDPWERVKLIEPGKKVQIRLRSGKVVKGTMAAWTADGLSVRQGKNEMSGVSKSDVVQVALVTGMSRGRKAMYAGLITGGVVGGIGGAACASNGCYDEGAILVPVAAAVWAGIAAGIASLFPQHKEVIYTAPPAAATAGRTDNAGLSSLR